MNGIILPGIFRKPQEPDGGIPDQSLLHDLKQGEQGNEQGPGSICFRREAPNQDHKRAHAKKEQRKSLQKGVKKRIKPKRSPGRFQTKMIVSDEYAKLAFLSRFYCAGDEEGAIRNFCRR